MGRGASEGSCTGVVGRQARSASDGFSCPSLALRAGSSFLVPKLCLGTPSAKLRFARPQTPDGRSETEFREDGSQTEFGNQKNQKITWLVASGSVVASVAARAVSLATLPAP